MTREDKFWKAILKLRCGELLDISRTITNGAAERFEDDHEAIYEPAKFAEMLADYADANLGEDE